MTNAECQIERICAIVSSGQGSRVLKIARRLGAPGGTILLGKGTARGFLDFLGLTDVRKEIVHIITGRATARRVLKGLDEELALSKPNHGIAYTTRVVALTGSRNCGDDATGSEGEEVSIMFHAITTIVEKGSAELVLDAAMKSGAKGGTIINARGSGIHESKKLFNMDIEPEKEMVLILVEVEKTDAIVEAIREGAHIDEPGRGILFVQEVQRAYGIMR